MSKYKVGMVLYGNDGYTYRVKAPDHVHWICSQCIFYHGGSDSCHMYNILHIKHCNNVEGVFEHIKIKGGI